jgi:hypothetical protein
MTTVGILLTQALGQWVFKAGSLAGLGWLIGFLAHTDWLIIVSKTCFSLFWSAWLFLLILHLVLKRREKQKARLHHVISGESAF